MAVVTGGRLLVADRVGGRVWYELGAAELATLPALYAACLARGAPHSLWLAPGRCAPAGEVSWWAAPAGAGAVWDCHTSGQADEGGELVPTSARVERRDVLGGRLLIVDLARDDRWPWSELDAEAIAAAVLGLEAALGVPLSVGPASTGLALLRHLSAGHPAWLGRDLTLPVPRGRDRALAWHRPLDRGDVGQYVHVYDTNAAYLAAAGSVRLGCGPPREVRGWHAGAVGQWHVELGDAGAWPWPRAIRQSGWHDTATVRAALALGQPISVWRGLIWPESHVVLRSWADRLWLARAPDVDAQQGDAVKRIYVQTFGLWNHPPRADRPSSWCRPDWTGAIIGEWARRFLARVQSWQAPVWLLHVDTAAVLSPSPDPAQAVPGVLDRAGKLSGMRHVCSVLVGDAVCEASREQYAGRVVERLIELAGEGGG